MSTEVGIRKLIDPSMAALAGRIGPIIPGGHWLLGPGAAAPLAPVRAGTKTNQHQQGLLVQKPTSEQIVYLNTMTKWN